MTCTDNRLARIRASIERINRLMYELKRLEHSAEGDKGENTPAKLDTYTSINETLD